MVCIYPLVFSAERQVRLGHLYDDILIILDKSHSPFLVSTWTAYRLKLHINFEVRAIAADIGTLQTSG